MNIADMIHAVLRGKAVEASMDCMWHAAKAFALVGRAATMKRRKLRPRATPRPYKGLRRRRLPMLVRAGLHSRAALEYGKAGIACAVGMKQI